jgi:hypothetical protein
LGLERGPLSLVSTVEELFERNSSGSVLEIREYGRRDPPRHSPSAKVGNNFADKRSVGIVRLGTQATEFFVYIYIYIYIYVCVCVCVCVCVNPLPSRISCDQVHRRL